MSTKPKYPYKWCAGVVHEFIEKYARGTYFLARMSGIPTHKVSFQLIEILSTGNSMKWEIIKNVIKSCETANFEDYKELGMKNRRLVLKYEYYYETDEYLDEKNTKF